MVNHFGVAHLIATTICTGIFLTAYDCLLKLYLLQEQITFVNNTSGFNNEKLPVLILKNSRKQRKFESTSDEKSDTLSSIILVAENSTEVIDPCSLKSYIRNIHTKVKPFTFSFTMFYVYCSCILLILLYFHLRKKLYRSNPSTIFFKIINPKSATFSSGAGLSLIVISVITSILTLNANNNIYCSIFLLFLHSQASIVGIVALCRIANVPCTRKTFPSKYPTIFLIFYLFVVFNGTLEILSKTIDADDGEPIFLLIIEVLTKLVDMIQAFLHGLLILVGFHVQVAPEIVANRKMPREILIHLAATNFSALISGIFNSKAISFKFIQKLSKRNEVNEINSTILWSVLASILSPCEEFNRFTTIIYLIKLYKMWSGVNN